MCCGGLGCAVLVLRWQAGVRVVGGFRGRQSRVIATPGVKSVSNGVAVSRDGTTLLVTDHRGGSHAIYEFRVGDGSLLRVVGSRGDRPLQFNFPRQVWIASDDFVFVVEFGNHRVQVLTPRLDFHAFVGVGHLSYPVGVCANDDVVMVSEHSAHRISVLTRGDGALLHRFGSYGHEDGRLKFPLGLCFMSGNCHVAVADGGNRRVSVFSLEGEFVHHVGVGHLGGPTGVACSAFDELIVADPDNKRVVVFRASGEPLKTMQLEGFVPSGVALHDSTSVFAQSCDDEKCVMFT
jgi:DNA-binding beta-propeller fold protein YncE